MDRDPLFQHAPADTLPVLEGEGKDVRLILGSAYGEKAPVETAAEMFYLDAVLEPGAQIPLPDDHEDRGAYVVEGEVSVAGEISWRPRRSASRKRRKRGDEKTGIAIPGSICRRGMIRSSSRSPTGSECRQKSTSRKQYYQT